jgi:hypothetical protein
MKMARILVCEHLFKKANVEKFQGNANRARLLLRTVTEESKAQNTVDTVFFPQCHVDNYGQIVLLPQSTHICSTELCLASSKILKY